MRGFLLLAGLVLAVAAWGRLTASGDRRRGATLKTSADAPKRSGRRWLRPGSRGPSLVPVLPVVGPGGVLGFPPVTHPRPTAGVLPRTRRVVAAVRGASRRQPRRVAATAGVLLLAVWGAAAVTWLTVHPAPGLDGMVGRLTRLLAGVTVGVVTGPLVVAFVYAVTCLRGVRVDDVWVTRWDALSRDGVGVDGRPVKAEWPGSFVKARALTVNPVTGGVAFAVLTVIPGRVKDTVSGARRKSDLIAKAYLTQPECVTVTADRDRWVVTVIPADEWEWRQRQAADEAARLAERVTSRIPWDGPTVDEATGTVELGRALHDWSPALLDLWTPGWGARHIWLLGDTGSGKTYCLDDILLDASASGLWVPHVIDLEDGPTLDGWRGVVPQFASTMTDAYDVWEGVRAEHERRKPLIKTLGVDVMAPTAENPGHLVVVDGGPKAVTDARFMEHLRTAAFEWRKFMMFVIWVTQPGTADLAFGSRDLGGTQLASQFKTRIGFRAGPEASSAMFGQQALLPGISEDTPGVAFIRSGRFPKPTLIKTKWQEDRAGLRDRWVRVPGWERPARPMPATAAGTAPDDAPAAPASSPAVSLSVDPGAVLREVLARGPMTESEIERVTGRSRAWVNKHVHALGAAGVAVKAGGHGGRWSLVEGRS